MRLGVSVDQQPLIEAQRNVNNLVIKFNQLQRIAGFALAAFGVGTLTTTSDAYATMANRLKSVTNSAEEFASAQRGVQQIADETLQPVEAVTEAFQRYSTATAGLNLTQEETLDFTKRLSQAISLGGATSAESAGALVQFGQGLANNFKSGGQEINSLIEQAPKLANMLAKAVGGPKAVAGQLKQMAKEGKLTGAVIVKAVRGMGKELDEAFGKKSIKFEDIGTLFKNKIMKVMQQASPVVERLTKSLKEFVDGPVSDWVNNGEAMNTLLAGAVVAVIALTAAFGSLALSIAAAAAPWVLLFLLIEDFVTFMRGGDSLIGRGLDALFGPDGAEKGRKAIFALWEDIKTMMASIADGTWWQKFLDAATHYGGLAFDFLRQQVSDLGKFLSDTVRLALGDKVADALGVAQFRDQPTKDESASSPMDAVDKWRAGSPTAGVWDKVSGMLNGASDAVSGWLRPSGPGSWNNEPSTNNSRLTPLGANGRIQPFGGGTPGYQLPALPEPTISDAAFRRAAADRAPGAAPQVTNNITVQGNADAQTARQIGKEAGNGTSTALGRDRSAIGGAMGMSQ